MENKEKKLQERVDQLSQDLHDVSDHNSKLECEIEDLRFEIRKLEKKCTYSFNVETLSDEMKFEILEDVFNKMDLQVIEERLGNKS